MHRFSLIRDSKVAKYCGNPIVIFFISCINPIFFVIKSITYMNFLLFYSQSKGVSDLWNDWRNLMNFKSQNHNTNSFKNKFQSHSTKIKSICKLINREREETSYKVYIHKPKGKRESQSIPPSRAYGILN